MQSILACQQKIQTPKSLSRQFLGATARLRGFLWAGMCQLGVILVLIRYYFDYERARIWRSGALETSRHDRSVQRPCRGFGGATWSGSVLRRAAPDQTEARANSSGFSDLQSQQVWVRISGWHPMKA